MLMINGELHTNLETSDAGTSAKAYQGGYWRFSSTTKIGEYAKTQMTTNALANAREMSTFGKRSNVKLPCQGYFGRHVIKTKKHCQLVRLQKA
jgi:TldD protein